MSSFRRRLMMAAAALPYDAEVEYLVASGQAGISTSVPVASDVTFDFGVDLPAQSSTNCVLFGRTETNKSLRVTNNTGALTFQYGSQSPTGTGLPAGTYRFTNTDNANVLKVTGDATRTVSASASTFASTSSNILYPFPSNGNVGVHWKACKIYKAGVLVRDFICVRKGGIGYMYDKVNGTLNGSVTANPFGYGPDKS